MGRDFDEAWIDEAIERYQRIEVRLAELDRAAKQTEVTVRSPDGLVEVVATADGTIRDVHIRGQARSTEELSRAVRDAVTAAADAAIWARQKLHAETFGAYQPLA
ncbi:YbaB/EbfC family nucleoid-associated protein [Planosporangium thailandense]|uniref:YbaB/EbfC family nucleoid-associated protein n=1 Tax=Planosporangium thailandense TaxID=765197 RepID=A0ABX0XVE1_9ACTN|nr:YbaB/EbfC family nucleoid-associated protein [Planosporangium thailandense]NJC69215.1 YbaB/EbfC family nucleoid-associated protein [Planosporangium thailandense]